MTNYPFEPELKKVVTFVTFVTFYYKVLIIKCLQRRILLQNVLQNVLQKKSSGYFFERCYKICYKKKYFVTLESLGIIGLKADVTNVTTKKILLR